MISIILSALHKSGFLSIIIEILRKLGLAKKAFRLYQVLIAMDWRIARNNIKNLGTQKDRVPIPPSQLRIFTVRIPDAAWFMESGKSAFEAILGNLQKME